MKNNWVVIGLLVVLLIGNTFLIFHFWEARDLGDIIWGDSDKEHIIVLPLLTLECLLIGLCILLVGAYFKKGFSNLKSFSEKGLWEGFFLGLFLFVVVLTCAFVLGGILKIVNDFGKTLTHGGLLGFLLMSIELKSCWVGEFQSD